MNKLRVLFILCSLLSSVAAFAYNITGRITDSDGKPIRKAVIIARNDTMKVVAGIESDQNGRFLTCEINEPRVIIEVQYGKMEPVYLQVAGSDIETLDIGTIALKPRSVELEEVEVVADAVVQKPDRYIVIPSRGEVERAATSLSLLNALKMNMPGLAVVEELNKITVDNRTPIIKINGKAVDMMKFNGLNPNDILKVEYFDSPDIRHNSYVINFVTKPRRDGGSIMLSGMSSLNTGAINGNVAATFYNKKSEWNINYGIQWRDYKKQEISSSARYIGSEDGDFVKTQVGLPSGMRYTDNGINLGYTYMHSANTMFSIDLSGALTDSYRTTFSSKITKKEAEKKVNNRLIWSNEFKAPSVSLFFRKQFKKGNMLEILANGRYNDGDYVRDYLDTDASGNDVYGIYTTTANKSKAVGGEIMYSKQFKNVTAKFGIQDNYNRAENEQRENGVINRPVLDFNKMYFYGSVTGRVKNLGYTVGVGGVYQHSSDGVRTMNATRFKGNINLNYRIKRFLSFNYLFMYDPSMPSFNQQSEVPSLVDDIEVSMGNMNLKPSVWYRNRLYIRGNYKKFTGTFWVSHSRTNDPILRDFQYIPKTATGVMEPYRNMFLSKPVNGLRDDRINLQLDLGFNNILNHFSIYGQIGWDDYTIHKKSLADGSRQKFSDKRLYAGISGGLYFGPWTISANYIIKPQYNLSGTTFSRNERSNMVQVQYRWNNLFVRLFAVNLFTKQGSNYHSFDLSDVRPYSSSTRLNNPNQIFLSLVYRMNFGKGFKKLGRSLKSGGMDTGVNTNY